MPYLMSDLDRDGRSPLHHAAFADDTDRAAALLEQGADPNLGDRMGFTPLHFAAQEGSVGVAELLFGAGADVDPVNSHGNTPLWTAVFNCRGDGEMIRLLRSRSADPNHENNAGNTPVGLARLIANYAVAQFFTDLP